jgi:hypothetical protein
MVRKGFALRKLERRHGCQDLTPALTDLTCRLTRAMTNLSRNSTMPSRRLRALGRNKQTTRLFTNLHSKHVSSHQAQTLPFNTNYILSFYTMADYDNLFDICHRHLKRNKGRYLRKLGLP